MVGLVGDAAVRTYVSFLGGLFLYPDEIFNDFRVFHAEEDILLLYVCSGRKELGGENTLLLGQVGREKDRSGIRVFKGTRTGVHETAGAVQIVNTSEQSSRQGLGKPWHQLLSLFAPLKGAETLAHREVDDAWVASVWTVKVKTVNGKP